VIAFCLLAVYLAALAVLAVAGMRKTTSLSSFAIGNRDMGPVLVGVVMASSIASTATFVINPGFVYGLGAASFVPIVFGVLRREPIPAAHVAIASGTALVVHFGLLGTVGTDLPLALHADASPAVSACYGILASVMIALALIIGNREARCHNQQTE
jgi:hypothetical protein